MRDFMDRFAAPIAGVIMLFIVGITIWGFRPAADALCGGGSNCFREWVSALSGWVAAVAAFITLTAIRHQIALQQRQIDFQLGDADPTMYARPTVDSAFQPILILTIENWNRRPIRLDSVMDGGTPPRIRFFPNSITIDGEQVSTHPFPLGLQGFAGNVILPGRRGGKGTPTATITCNVEIDGSPDAIVNNLAVFRTEILCEAYQMDSKHRQITISASTILNYVLSYEH